MSFRQRAVVGCITSFYSHNRITWANKGRLEGYIWTSSDFHSLMFAFCVCLSVLQWPWRLILAGSCWRTHTCSTQEQVSWCWDQCLWSAASCLWASLALSWVNHPLMLLYHIHMPYIHGLKFTHKVPNASKNQSWRVYETVLLFSWPVTFF